MTFKFNYDFGSTCETIHTEVQQFDFFNLKNKATGPRRYGYQGYVRRYINSAGEVAFRAEYQTTLDGERYQSGKYSNFTATGAEAVDLLAKTLKGALRRYAKLAKDPANKIEHRATEAA